MPSHILQFPILEALLTELPSGHLVRVAALDVTEAHYRQASQVRIAGIGVHVRAINEEGHILSCYLPVAQLQIFGQRPRPGDPDEPAYRQAWAQARALKERLSTCLTDRGLCVRDGVIHLGDVQLLHGAWPGDPDHQEADEPVALAPAPAADSKL